MRRKPRARDVLLALLVAALQPAVACAVPNYVAVRLGTLGGSLSTSAGINDRGEVVGWAWLPGDRVGRAFLHRNGTMVDLGAAPDGTCSAALAINASGTIVGFSDFACEANYRPTVVANGAMNYLDAGFVFGQATAINEAGTIVGWRQHGGGNRAFVWTAGVTSVLGTLGGRDSYAHGINDRGVVVGESTLQEPTSTMPYPPAHAFVRAAGTLVDLGTLGGRASAARAINSHGQITGGAAIAGDAETHAFLYANGVMRDLDTLAGSRFSVGLAINDAGHVVGEWFRAIDSERRAFLHDGNAMVDLNDLVVNLAGHTVASAAGINDSGQIAATVCNPAFACVAYRLDPLPPAAAVAGVPATSFTTLAALALLVGATGMASRRRRARQHLDTRMSGLRRRG
jgi:probable HAF family extracellular repeat protein